MLRNPTGLPEVSCLKKQTRFHLADKALNLRGIKERERDKRERDRGQ